MSNPNGVKVDDDWFVVSRGVKNMTPQEKIMFEAWKQYAKAEGDFGPHGLWCSRVEKIVSYYCRAEDEFLPASCITTSIVIWFTVGGWDFIRETLKKTKVRPTMDDTSNLLTVLGSWAYENRRANHLNFGKRALEGILDRELTVFDHEIAEAVMAWVADEEGREFLFQVFEKLNFPITWERPHVIIPDFEMVLLNK